jgi:hypothetical protein
MAISTTRKASFLVTLSVPSTSTVTIDYATAAGTAVEGVDFAAVSGTLTFAPGDTTKTIDVYLGETSTGGKTFDVALSNPHNCTIGAGGGHGAIGAAITPISYLDRFDYMYAALKNTSNGYFGPPTGPKAFTIPYHCPEKLIAEAPDYGHESVSETASFWVGLEAWQGMLHNDWVGYAAAWNSIETNYIPSDANQPIGAYTPGSPASYQPEGDLPSAYPVLTDISKPVGTDGLYDELHTTYSTKSMYLMHWLLDVDGAFGYKNGDGATVATYINNFQRGLQESTFETVTFPCWEDYTYGNAHGYLPLYGQGTEDYPAAPYAYSKQWRYTCAPDAESRALQWAFRAKDVAGGSPPSQVTAGDTKAKKMGDYLRYALMDKYFRKIGDNQYGSSSAHPYDACHYLVSWYCSWGGEVPASPGTPGSWSFRIGSSEAHIGYQAPNIAYQMATGGGGHAPLSPSAGDIWLGSLYRQLEMLRWLQTSKGLLAGGVSNSIYGRYLQPASWVSAPDNMYYPQDGREVHTFYGMVYVYAPVWHDPPSNNWFGFNVWGMGRLAELFHTVSDKTNALAVSIRPNCEIILDRWMGWVLDNVVLNPDNTFTLPDTLSWVTDAPIAGHTTTHANLEGKYEYLPSMTWPGTGTPDYASFWNASTVPNPNLDFTVVATGSDLGVGSSLASALILYAQAKRNMGKFTTMIPNSSSKTPHDCYVLAKALIDRVWDNYKVTKGVAVSEQRSDYKRYGDPVYVPSIYSGHMPNGDAIHSGSTFISIRSFMETDPDYTQIAAYVADPTHAPVPTFTYHRFWAQTEFAMACGAMHKYFADLAEV